MPLTLNALPNAVLAKNTTQKIHTEVEDFLLPRLSSIQTTHDYAIILKMFYGYFKPVEDAIALQVTPAFLPDIAERKKAAFVLHDLHQIGHGADALLECTALPEIASPAQAFGALYVLEGSTLGGKMIARMLAKNPLLLGEATRFFSGYGEQTGPKWKGFLEAFNRQPDPETLVTSASETFLHLKRWMQPTR